MADFIVTEPIEDSKKDSEKRVWDAVGKAFSDGVGYWGYPLFLFLEAEGRRKEPDIVVAERELGIVVIEVVAVAIEQIADFTNGQLYFQNTSADPGLPLQRGANYIQVLRKYCDQESEISGKVTGRSLVAFPYISTQQWQERGLPGLEDGSPLIFQNQLGEKGLSERVEKAVPIVEGEHLDDSQWGSLLTVLSGTPILRKPPRPDTSSDGKTRSSILATLSQQMYEWDLQQEQVGKTIPTRVQRVRGIAGSGKTVLFAQKVAHIHLKHPDWDIALVFFTRSLYDQIIGLISRWIDRFTNGEVSYNHNKLRVLHAWGAKDRDGLYGEICQFHNKRRGTVRDTPEGKPNRGLADLSKRLLKEDDIKPMFDAILIDEGQDLVTEEDLKHEDKQAIYWMAWQALRPIDSTQPNSKRLIFAYDEAQSLYSQVIPSASKLFGSEPHFKDIFRGKGSEVMRRCYRTPGEILTTAYAIGAGLEREGGFSTNTKKESRLIMQQREFNRIGYEVEGNFKTVGEKIVLRRPKQNSPNPAPKLWGESVINFETFNSRQEELAALAKKIQHNLSVDGLNPSRDILVIALGYTTPPNYEANNLETEIANFLLEKGIDIYIPSALKANDVKPRFPHINRDFFWSPPYQSVTGVTISRIDRAKGNEAEMVYVVGLDNIARHDDDNTLRNQLFVALTRSRAWVNLSGIGNYPLYDEIHRVFDKLQVDEDGNLSYEFEIKSVSDLDDDTEDEDI